MNLNVAEPYAMRWLTLVSGHASQEAIFEDQGFWAARFREWFESGTPFKNLDSMLGNPSAIFQEWIRHPHLDAYWDRYNPTPAEYAKLTLPILTITGAYDGDQLGALAHYRSFMQAATTEARAQHYLVIGPWDHAGTRTPKAEFGGLSFGPQSLLDLAKLHLNWYSWTLQGGVKPEFLRKLVAYYVMQADEWRYADTLESVTASTRALYLNSRGSANDVLASGSLTSDIPEKGMDRYVYDPHDISTAALESSLDFDSSADQTMVYAMRGKELVYHSAPFIRDTEVSGFFRLSAWIGLDQPDTDFNASIYEILNDGRSIPLASQVLRARYRESLREPELVHTRLPLRYNFTQFTFVSRQLSKGSRLRLVIAPLNSIYSEKNYNGGGEVATESMRDARAVTVTLYHDRAHVSTLFVPIGRPRTLGDVPLPPSVLVQGSVK